jgi:hypothetical protein
MTPDLKASIDWRLKMVVRYAKLCRAEKDPLAMASLGISYKQLGCEIHQVENAVMTIALSSAVYEDVLTNGLTIARTIEEAKKRIHEAMAELRDRNLAAAQEKSPGNGSAHAKEEDHE